MSPFERLNVLGCPVDYLNEEQLMDFVDHSVANNSKASIMAVNPEKAIKIEADQKLSDALHKSQVLIPDGIGMVFAVRYLLKRPFNRVAGSDFMVKLCEHSAQKSYKLFLLGAENWVNEKAVSELKTRFPQIEIVGNRDGFFDHDNCQEVIDEINQSKANVLFVALGSPRQEKWISANIDSLNVNIIQGVGGTFDVIAGNVKRAPKFFIRLNLEWFYRLLAEPKRVARQTALPKFFFRMVKSMVTEPSSQGG